MIPTETLSAVQDRGHIFENAHNTYQITELNKNTIISSDQGINFLLCCKHPGFVQEFDGEVITVHTQCAGAPIGY